MKKEGLVLRQALAPDHPAMKAILQDTFESTWRPNIRPATVRAYLEEDRGGVYVDEYGHDFWLAESEGAVVGLVHWQDDFIHALHVLSTQSRRGAGRCLLDLAEQAIADAGFRQVRLETDTFNTGSCAFYRARGYAEAGRYPDEEWDSGLTTVLFVKKLDQRS